MAALPVPVFDEQRAIDHVAFLAGGLLPRMDARFSHARLAELLRDHLRRGDLVTTMKAVVAAERDGDWLADTVLRQTFAEMDTNHEPMSDQLRAFGQRAVLRPPVQRRRGRNEYDDWCRNIAICILIQRTCAEFNVRPTRSRRAAAIAARPAAAWSSRRSSGTKFTSRKTPSSNTSGLACSARSRAKLWPTTGVSRFLNKNNAISYHIKSADLWGDDGPRNVGIMGIRRNQVGEPTTHAHKKPKPRWRRGSARHFG